MGYLENEEFRRRLDDLANQEDPSFVVDSLNLGEPGVMEDVERLLAEVGDFGWQLATEHLKDRLTYHLRTGGIKLIPRQYREYFGKRLPLYNANREEEFKLLKKYYVDSTIELRTAMLQSYHSTPLKLPEMATVAAATQSDTLYDLHIVLEYKHSTVITNNSESIKLPMDSVLKGGVTRQHTSKGTHINKMNFEELPMGEYTLNIDMYNVENRSLK